MSKAILCRLCAAVFVLGMGSVSVTACNTVEGVGKDVSAAGKGVSRGAKNTKDKM